MKSHHQEIRVPVNEISEQEKKKKKKEKAYGPTKRKLKETDLTWHDGGMKRANQGKTNNIWNKVNEQSASESRE